MSADPLAVIAAALARGEPPPLEWAIEYAPDGDVDGAVARLWERSDCSVAMLYLVCRASLRGIAWPDLWQYALDAIRIQPQSLDSEVAYWGGHVRGDARDSRNTDGATSLRAVLSAPRVTPLDP